MTFTASGLRVPALILGLSVAGFSACGLAAGETRGGAAPPIRCELILDEARGATTIEGRVTADRPVNGSYRLTISSISNGGRSVINQSGDFRAAPGAPAILGQTTLGGSRAQYRADLELSVPGERLSCAGRSGAQTL